MTTTKYTPIWSTWLAWSPIFLTLAWFAVFSLLPRELTCSDGEENVCGASYWPVALTLAFNGLRILFVLLVAGTLVLALRRQLTLLGWGGLAVSLAFALLVAYALYTYKNDCFP